MTTDPSPKPVNDNPRHTDEITLLAFTSAPKTCHRQDCWPPEPQQQLTPARAASGALQKPSLILPRNGGFSAIFSGSGPPVVFPL